jgi:hypothetical protein
MRVRVSFPRFRPGVLLGPESFAAGRRPPPDEPAPADFVDRIFRDFQRLERAAFG